MPPKKKRKVVQEKPGVSHEYLAGFSDIPDGGGTLKNGHILHQFVKADRSFVNVVKTFHDKGFEMTSNNVQNLVKRSLMKFRNLNRESDLNHFKQICDEEFKASCVVKKPVACEENKKVSPPRAAEKETPNLRNNQSDVTPQNKLNRRLEFVSSSKAEMKKTCYCGEKVKREATETRPA